MTDEQLTLAMPPSSYHHDSDMIALVQRVIGEHAQLAHLRGAKLVALRRETRRTDDSFAPDRAGGAFLRSDRERGVTSNWDAGVWMRGRWWDAMAPDQRRAWVFHLLSHLALRPGGEGLTKVGHDVEAFTDEALLFGTWEAQLSLFAENLDRHALPPVAGDARPPKKARAVLDDEGRATGVAPN